MFNAEYFARICDLYGCQRVAVARDGTVTALRGDCEIPIPDFVLDTDTAVATEEAAVQARAAVETARLPPVV